MQIGKNILADSFFSKSVAGISIAVTVKYAMDTACQSVNIQDTEWGIKHPIKFAILEVQTGFQRVGASLLENLDISKIGPIKVCQHIDDN
jgi:hypothetical protein